MIERHQEIRNCLNWVVVDDRPKDCDEDQQNNWDWNLGGVSKCLVVVKQHDCGWLWLVSTTTRKGLESTKQEQMIKATRVKVFPKRVCLQHCNQWLKIWMQRSVLVENESCPQLKWILCVCMCGSQQELTHLAKSAESMLCTGGSWCSTLCVEQHSCRWSLILSS